MDTQAALQTRVLVLVPRRVDVVGPETLRYSGGWTQRQVGPEILTDLVELAAERTAPAAAAFVRRYGRLAPRTAEWRALQRLPETLGRIAQVGADALSGQQPPDPAAELAALRRPQQALAAGQAEDERLAPLRWFVQGLAEVAAIAPLVSAGRPLPSQVLARQFGLSRRQRALDRDALAAEAAAVLSWAVRQLQLRPVLTWHRDPGAWRITVSTEQDGSVSCALAAAAYFAVARLTQPLPGDPLLASCSLCGRLFEAARRPRQDQAAYCPDCRGSAAMWRAIKRRQRARR